MAPSPPTPSFPSDSPRPSLPFHSLCPSLPSGYLPSSLHPLQLFHSLPPAVSLKLSSLRPVVLEGRCSAGPSVTGRKHPERAQKYDALGIAWFGLSVLSSNICI
ncbi:hypothetical protein RJT34_16113 [Clitoria ternatea]|uniref:Uncharacterized protein n=1 Tax=Clitoria ternatea TaxID=43366 RepID=A0AAN9J6L8_CLITE